MARFDRVIPPGEEGKVIFEVDTADLQGDVTKGLTVFSNDPHFSRLRLQFNMNVIPLFEIRPKGQAYFRINRGEPWSGRFHLTSSMTGDFQITRVLTQSGFFKVDTNRVKMKEDRAGYGIIVTMAEDIPLGQVRERIQIFTNISNAEPAEIRILGKVEGAIAYFPDRIDLRPHPAYMDGQSSANVHLTRSDGDQFNVKGVDTGHQNIRHGIITVEEGRGYVLVLIWSGESPTRRIAGEIVVTTDDQEMPKIRIPYVVMPIRR